jgi:hypothetical protein
VCTSGPWYQPGTCFQGTACTLVCCPLSWPLIGSDYLPLPQSLQIAVLVVGCVMLSHLWTVASLRWCQLTQKVFRQWRLESHTMCLCWFSWKGTAEVWIPSMTVWRGIQQPLHLCRFAEVDQVKENPFLSLWRYLVF